MGRDEKEDHRPEDDGGPKPSDSCGHMQNWIGAACREKLALHYMNFLANIMDCVLVLYLSLLCTCFISSWVLPRLADSKKVAGCFNEGGEDISKDKESGCVVC